MYDLPEIEAATDAWWKGLARAFRREGIADVPDVLWRGESYRELWARDALLLSQTCGYPLMHDLRGKVTLVATPCYSAPGCNGPDYCSIVVVHEDSTAGDISDLDGTRCVVNNRDSQSGYNALRALIAPIASGKRFFQSVTISGSHLNSLKMVAEGEADVAAVDCVTHELLARFRINALHGTRPLCLTPRAPALPYITSGNARGQLVARLCNGLQAACDDPTLSDSRQTLMIQDFCVLPITEYERIADMERDAAAGRSEFGWSPIPP